MCKKLRLIGKLPEDKHFTILGLYNSIHEVEHEIDEYQSVFEDIEIKVQTGQYTQPLSFQQKKAIANLMAALFGPLQNFSLVVTNIKR